MAQTGYTPIQLYYSTTNTNVPTAGNLLPGELGFNIHSSDFSLYAENSAGVVKRIMNNPAGLKYPTADGTSGQAVVTNGSGTLSFSTVLTSPFTGNVSAADYQISRAMLIDCGNTVVDKGNSGTSTQTYDYTAGSVQTSTATGNHTLATSNWPPTGNLGVMLILLTNGGAYTLTMPTINWIQPSGVVTTSFSTYLASLTGRTALQSSGTDQILWWTRDAGTTIYGKLV